MESQGQATKGETLVEVVYSGREAEAFDPPPSVYLGVPQRTAEVPARSIAIASALRDLATTGEGKASPFRCRLREPREYGVEVMERVHDPAYLAFLRNVNSSPLNDSEFVDGGQPPQAAYPFTFPYVQGISKHSSGSLVAQMGRYCFDLATPITASTWPAALKSAECVLTAVDILLQRAPLNDPTDKGKQVDHNSTPAEPGVVLALCRPPGHHAMKAMSGGYCYINNVAVGAQYVLDSLGPEIKVAILDVDFHHGNGTQDIFYDTDRVLFVSLHHTPESAYPYFSGFEDERGKGRGEGFNINFPLPSHTDEALYTQTLHKALDIIRAYSPDFLFVSLGFDTFKADPISCFNLSETYYEQMASLIAALRLPTVLVVEGGYAVEKLGELTVNFLRGWLGR